MDKTTKVFDSWAKAGRAEEMEEGHGVTVGKFLGSISFDKPFSFLDIGCGNGWVVRKIAQLPKCKKAVGIDKSKNMIKRAVSNSTSKKEKYACTDLESWNYAGKFDVDFFHGIVILFGADGTSTKQSFQDAQSWRFILLWD